MSPRAFGEYSCGPKYGLRLGRKIDIDEIKDVLKHDELALRGRSKGSVHYDLNALANAVDGSAIYGVVGSLSKAPLSDREVRKLDGIRDEIDTILKDIERGEAPKTHRERAEPRRQPNQRVQLARRLGEIEVRLRELEKDGTMDQVISIVTDVVETWNRLQGGHEERSRRLLGMISGDVDVSHFRSHLR